MPFDCEPALKSAAYDIRQPIDAEFPAAEGQFRRVADRDDPGKPRFSFRCARSRIRAPSVAGTDRELSTAATGIGASGATSAGPTG